MAVHPAVDVGLPPAPVRPGSPLTDRGAMVLAVAVAVGAWLHHPLPGGLAAPIAIVAWALVRRRPLPLVLGAALLASVLGARSMAGMGPVPVGTYAGPVTLLSDPEPMAFGSRADVRVGSRHLEMWATGSASGTVSRAAAGERLIVSGRTRPPPPDAPWLVPRHIVGRLDVSGANALDGGQPQWQAANRFRRVLAAGASAIPEQPRSLYSGFVLGDDRGQRPEVVDDFKGSGLSHLLVVSGENVAFVLVLVSPLTVRLRLGARWAVTIGVVLLFGTVTRFEPSVLRASAMAALAVSASFLGRPTSTIRLVSLASAGLLLVDPLLVRSVGFQLSVAASVGIALLAPPIARAIPGPGVVVEAIAVTIAAQVGVAPVLVPQFGGLPVVSVPANLLAVPAAGLVTTWGLPAGLVAGLVGHGSGRVLHLPTRALVWWVAGVARWSARLPLGEVGLLPMALLGVAGVALVWVRRHRPAWRWVRRALLAAMVTVLLAPAASLRSPPERTPVPGGVLVRRSTASVLVLDGRTDVAGLLEALRRAGTTHIDLVVGPSEGSGDLVRALRHRWPMGPLLDPTAGPTSITVGALEVGVDVAGKVTVGPGSRDGPGR
jgi:competence protein ComEC